MTIVIGVAKEKMMGSTTVVSVKTQTLCSLYLNTLHQTHTLCYSMEFKKGKHINRAIRLNAKKIPQARSYVLLHGLYF